MYVLGFSIVNTKNMFLTISFFVTFLFLCFTCVKNLSKAHHIVEVRGKQLISYFIFRPLFDIFLERQPCVGNVLYNYLHAFNRQWRMWHSGVEVMVLLGFGKMWRNWSSTYWIRNTITKSTNENDYSHVTVTFLNLFGLFEYTLHVLNQFMRKKMALNKICTYNIST